MSDSFAVAASDLLRWSETLSAIARTGLGFTQSLYEKERFEEILKVAADIRAGALEEAETDALFEEWLATVGEGVAGYVTPKVAVAAVVGNDKGEILLTHRADGFWLYPVGWADVGYSPSEVAVKEVYEETGIEVEPLALIAVLDGMRLGFARIPLYSLVFHCRVIGGELRGHPLETRAVGFFPRDALPQPLAGANRWCELAFDAIDGKAPACSYDPPRTPPWREAAGHLAEDTAANRAIIQAAADNGVLVRTSPQGVQTFRQLLPDGTEAWAEVYQGQITNGGVNIIPRSP